MVLVVFEDREWGMQKPNVYMDREISGHQGDKIRVTS